MAIDLTFLPESELLNAGSLPAQRYYVRCTGCVTNTVTNTGYIPLLYKALDENGQPTGDWLRGLPLPATVPVMRPRELMLAENTTPYRQAYDLARTHLTFLFAGQATVEDLL